MEKLRFESAHAIDQPLTELCDVVIALWIAISVIQDRFPPRHAGKLQ